jgi:hypothetical protein
MSTKRKKQIEYDKRVFVDRYGHPYHQLAWGVEDGPNPTPHLEILFSRVEFPTDEGDTHEFMITMGGHTEVLPRSMLIEMLLHGWNGELMNERLICDDPGH